MSWNVNFNKRNAENVYYAIQKNNHLKGFKDATDKFERLKGRLEELLSESDWWSRKCKDDATHYEFMQKQLQDKPDDLTDDHAREVSCKSPQLLNGYAAALDDGANKLRNAIYSVKEILTKIRYAEDDAKAESKKVLEKIVRAIDLMDSYLRVSF